MANFSVAARTLIHLGAELITSDEVALNELIKNAFDAESARVQIRFRIGMQQDLLDRLLAAARSRTGTAGVAAFSDEVVTHLNAAGAAAGGDAGRAAQLVEYVRAATDWAQLVSILERVNSIVVSDRGCGMDSQALELVFLQIGTPSRLEAPTSAQLNRTLLGNKGIGRLAMMRLGDRATVTSWTAPTAAHQIAFDWRAFETSELTLDAIRIVI